MNSAFDMYRMMAAAAESFMKYAWMNPEMARSAPADNAQKMWRLYMAFVNSSYRYLARWAEISSKRFPELAKACPLMNPPHMMSDAEMGVLMDSFRAYVREMAELPVEESKRLQSEIDGILMAGREERHAHSHEHAHEPEAAPKARSRRPGVKA